MSSDRGRGQGSRGAALGLGALLTAVAAWHGWSRAFVQDDAYISFRYADNWLAGHGLVYNPGEWVEGISNLGWTVMVALGMALGLEPETAATGLSGLAWLATPWAMLGVAVVHARRLGVDRSAWDAAPLALVGLLVLNPSAAAYATGGLETAWVALLGVVLGGLVLGGDRGWGLGAVALGLCLLRLDAVFVVGPLLGLVLADGWARGEPAPIARARLGRALAVLAVGLGLLFLWKATTYGAILPNTFHAKSAGRPYPSRGIRYLGAFYLSYPYLLLGLVGPLAAWAVRRERTAVAPVGLALAAGVHQAWVVWVGGGFMEFKPLIHSLALLVLAAVLSGVSLWRAAGPARAGVGFVGAVLLALAAVLPAEVPVALKVLSTEQLAAQVEGPEGWAQLGEVLGEVLPPQTTIALGAAGALPYRSGLRTVDTFGLTDPVVARQALAERGVVGHEKRASEAHLRDRGVHLLVYVQPVLPRSQLPRSAKEPRVYIRVGEDAWIRTDVVVPSRALFRHAQASPDRFVVVRRGRR